MRGRRDTRETGDRENDTTRDAKLREIVLALLVRGLCSHSLTSQDDPQVLAALQAKYTERSRDLPSRAQGTVKWMDRMEGLKEDLLGLDQGVAPCFGGLRKDHL